MEWDEFVHGLIVIVMVSSYHALGRPSGDSDDHDMTFSSSSMNERKLLAS
jgi:hypothetical protein